MKVLFVFSMVVVVVLCRDKNSAGRDQDSHAKHGNYVKDTAANILASANAADNDDKQQDKRGTYSYYGMADTIFGSAAVAGYETEGQVCKPDPNVADTDLGS